MAFVNEEISAEDFEKYNFKKINNRMNGLRTPTSQWTIDRENDIWLRRFYKRQDHTAPDGGYTGENIWDFYWKGTLISLETMYIKTIPSSENKGTYYADIELLSIKMPDELLPEITYILEDIKKSFIAYAGGGIYSEADNCHIDFKYKGASI